MRRPKSQRGVAVIEYVLVLPVLLLLFLGSLVFRVISIKQSLHTGLQQAIPYYTHWREHAPHYGDPAYVISQELGKNRQYRRECASARSARFWPHRGLHAIRHAPEWWWPPCRLRSGRSTP